MPIIPDKSSITVRPKSPGRSHISRHRLHSCLRIARPVGRPNLLVITAPVSTSGNAALALLRADRVDGGAPVITRRPIVRHNLPQVSRHVVEAKGYEYQYLFCRNSSHGIRNAKAQFLPHAFEWVWQGYGSRKIK